ncbi:SPOR domain-containing protein [Pseudodesulfovibrio sp.]|uniref:SPOR domain-containing protein n=1 Tax=Pseudodesulfovibrio sp. TaxID=2035812 RepID=UPI002632AEB9|nr:SPOR domain-containing protein [Pseudodesulfovibrio sp.]MDD3311680.1 SPOR domain-containing protein [Pseudodesulfovibrio sp.]
MKRIIRNTLTALAATLLGLTLLGGCFRQHIESSTPPGVTRVGPTPAARSDHAEPPKVIDESAATPEAAKPQEPGPVIEETYVVDAPKEAEAPEPQVSEGDLDAEPAPATAPAAKPAPAPAAKPAAIAPEADAAVAPEVMGDMFYVQVGSFSELENANKVLASLIDRGYDGSKLVMTDDGQFRVQAGAFTDKTAARTALDKLLPAFKGAFILKGTPE